MSTADAVPGRIPSLDGPPPSVLMVRAPYYRAVVEGLEAGAAAVLKQAGARHDVLDVAGAYELPQALRLVLAGRARFDGYVALGCVVRGETDHYDHLCAATMDGLMRVAVDHAICLGVGLLTVDRVEQAAARAGGGHNKGAEAAVACLLQIGAARRFGASPRAV